MSVPARYAVIDFVPPMVVARRAEEGLQLRRTFGRGGTMVGVARARDLKNRRRLSPETIRRMNSFFARHAVDKRGKDFFNDVRPSNGRIAWLLWGGDEGWEWADRILQQMKDADAGHSKRSA